MSSQDSSTSIPFLHAPDGAGYRLLELPSDLVAEASSPWLLHADGAGMARLRTAQGRTYALRQKNTSNALMLLSVRSDSDAGGAAAETAAEGAAETAAETAGPKPSLAIAATLHETVELVEVTAEEEVSASVSSVAPKAIPSRGKWHEKFAKTR